MALKVGTEDKKKVYMAAGLGAVMLILLVRFLWQTFGPLTGCATTGRAGSHRGSSHNGYFRKQRKTQLHRAASAPGSEGWRLSRARSYAAPGNHASGRVARVHRPRPQHLLPVLGGPGDTQTGRSSAAQAHVDTGPPPPPPPPPINLGFYGYAAEKTGQKQVFLLHGDDIFIASEGDVVDRRYKVVKINAASVQVEDIPYHNTQTLPLRQ